MEQEITGANNVILSLSPSGKSLKLMQWSGDTMPFEAFLRRTREAGMVNMNGGDSRFDADYPSYAWVPPIGIQVGKEYQVYSGNSNENTYTNTWLEMFHAFRYLRETAERTEHPLRVKPLNVYYHVYSAQYPASINALKQNLDYARAQPLARIAAGHYAALAAGFRPLTLTPLAPHHWRIEKQGELRTLRFDDALATMAIDWNKSKGVMGYHVYQNSLYVALDPSAQVLEVALRNTPSPKPNLRESRWPLQNMRWEESAKRMTFRAGGYGDAEMIWQDLLPKTAYRLTHQGTRVFEDVTDDRGTLTIRFPFQSLTPKPFMLEQVR
jgi:hypothetical protein